MKECKSCLKNLPFDRFKKYTSGSYRPRCKDCARKADRPRYLEYMKEYNADPDHKEQYRNANYLRKYGVDIEWYNKKLKEQNGLCAICSADNPRSKRSKYFFIDHDHQTGSPRGLLCMQCNFAVGNIADTPRTAHSLIEYLEKYGYS